MPVPFAIIKFLARTGLGRFIPRVRQSLGDSARVLHHISDRLLAMPLSTINDLTQQLDDSDLACIDLSGDAKSANAPATNLGIAPTNHVPLSGLRSLRE